MLGLRHVALRVRDIDRSLEFYTCILKMRVEWRPDPANVYLTSGSDNLALHQIDASSASGQIDASSVSSPVETAPGLDHFGFVVSTPDEVDRWAREIEAGGIRLVQQPKTHRDGARSIYFRDPDGNLLQLLYHPPIA